MLREHVPNRCTGLLFALLVAWSLLACTKGRPLSEDVSYEPVDAIVDDSGGDAPRQPDEDLQGDACNGDEVSGDMSFADAFDRAAAWKEFGDSHLLLAVNSNSLTNQGGGAEVHAEDWVAQLEVVLHRTEAPLEVAFDTAVYEGPDFGIAHPFTHVAAVAIGEEEVVEICLSLYALEGDLRATACRETTIRPGTTGQVLWQLSAGECTSVYGPSCPSPQTENLTSLPNDSGAPPVLSFDVILAHESGSVTSEPVPVSLGVHPPVSCEKALQLYAEDIAGAEHESTVDCVEPPGPDYIAGTELTVHLASPEAAIGLVHHILTMPNGYPARTLWDEASATQIADTLVGVSYDEIGTGKAEKPCEWWTCP